MLCTAFLFILDCFLTNKTDLAVRRVCINDYNICKFFL